MPTLDWIGKSKVVNHHLDVPYCVLERIYSYDENGQHEEDNGSENMIIHGDNLLALKSLLPQYEGRIKCIYIDPPYNTGNENWVYNDNVNDPRIKKWLGEVVGKEGEDLSRHDKWLCILNGAGNAKWHDSNIKQILTNEKYMGDALLQKTFTVNTLEKKRVKNNGYAPKYYVEGSHEPIISRNVFLRVQAEIARRANMLTNGKRRIYSSQYALSSIVFCGHCGDIYRRIKWNNRGRKSTVWRCVSRVNKKTSGIDCPARTIREEDLKKAVVTAVNDAWAQKDRVIPILKENIRIVMRKDIEERLATLDSALKGKQDELVKAEPNQTKKIKETITSLRNKQQEILTEMAEDNEKMEKLEKLITFLDQQTEAITEYSEILVRRLIEKITVYDEKLTVEFKSGLEMEVEI